MYIQKTTNAKPTSIFKSILLYSERASKLGDPFSTKTEAQLLFANAYVNYISLFLCHFYFKFGIFVLVYHKFDSRRIYFYKPVFIFVFTAYYFWGICNYIFQFIVIHMSYIRMTFYFVSTGI